MHCGKLVCRPKPWSSKLPRTWPSIGEMEPSRCRSFVQKITDNGEDAAIVRSLIAMAHNLGLVVIAEGVETEAQAAFLVDEKCEEAQGFLYATPLPASEFEGYLKTRALAP